MKHCAARGRVAPTRTHPSLHSTLASLHVFEVEASSSASQLTNQLTINDPILPAYALPGYGWQLTANKLDPIEQPGSGSIRWKSLDQAHLHIFVYFYLFMFYFVAFFRFYGETVSDFPIKNIYSFLFF